MGMKARGIGPDRRPMIFVEFWLNWPRLPQKVELKCGGHFWSVRLGLVQLCILSPAASATFFNLFMAINKEPEKLKALTNWHDY